MRTALSVVVVVFLCATGARAQVPIAEDVDIPMRDGAALAATVVRPGDASTHGAVLVITPYDRAFLPGLLADPEHGFGPDWSRSRAWVLVDARGYFGSLGAVRLGSDQGVDGYDVVEWIAGRPWSNGRVAMWGSSALGRVQFDTAAEQPPHLVGIVPLAAPYAFEYDQFFTGGVLRQEYARDYGILFPAFGILLRQHPQDDATWQALAAEAHPERIDVPVLLISAWWDLHPADVLQTFGDLLARGGPSARSSSRIVMGPWIHTAIGDTRQGEVDFPEAAGVSGTEAEAFFARWLDGVMPATESPRVRWFQQGTNDWHDADTWPPAGDAETRLYLGGKALRTAAPPGEGSRHYVYRPRDPSPTVGGQNLLVAIDPQSLIVGAGPRDQHPRVEMRKDGAWYTSGPLTADVVLRGAPSLTLFVSSNRRDTDFAVRLTDVQPDGRSMLVGDSTIGARYRASLTAPKLLQVGRMYRVTVAFDPTAYTFVAGHRIRIGVTSSNAPRFAPNPNVPRDGLAPRNASNAIYTGPRHPSVLVLPGPAS